MEHCFGFVILYLLADPQHDLQFSAIPRLPWCSCLAQGSSLACWVKPPRNFCDPTAWGLLAPRRGPDVLVRIRKNPPFGDLPKKLGSFLRHEQFRVSFLQPENPWFQKMCPDTLAPPLLVFSAPPLTSTFFRPSGLESAWDAPGPRPKFKRLLPHQRPVQQGTSSIGWV